MTEKEIERNDTNGLIDEDVMAEAEDTDWKPDIKRARVLWLRQKFHERDKPDFEPDERERTILSGEIYNKQKR